MKKALTLITSLALTLLLIAGCGNQGSSQESNAQTENILSEENIAEEAELESLSEEHSQDLMDKEEALTDIRVMALKGPTAMGLVKLMDEAEGGSVNSNNYDFSIVTSVDEVMPKLVQGEVDIAAVPANLASVLYNNTQKQVQVLAINTLGVLYIVDTGNTVHSVGDLKGRTIYASGKGATPEYALNYILMENGIDPEKDVTIEWKSEHTECVAALTASSQESEIALLPQPFVTTAQAKNDKIRIALDLNQEWDKVQTEDGDSSALLTGVIIVRTEFAKEYPDAVNAFLDSYKESVSYVNGNIEDAAALIEKFDIVPAAVASKALPYCNITFIEGTEMQNQLSGYLNVLMEQNEKAVGGAVPEDDFYYRR